MRTKLFFVSTLCIIFLTLVSASRVVANAIKNETETDVYLPLVFKNEITPTNWAFVPAGEFQMGCDPMHFNCNNWITPAKLHLVYLDAYFIDIYEVTNSRYAACVSAGACTEPAKLNSYTRSSYYGNPQYANYPVIFVNWFQANTFCEWEGHRLPTEAEWEKAARGNQSSNLFPWGSTDSCSLANYKVESILFSYYCVGDTTEVGSYPAGASPYGLMDMAGNNWEWVSDYFDVNYYDYSPYNNPTGPETGFERTFRGGSWFSNYLDMTSFFRYGLNPSTISDDLGFRCAYTP